MYAVLRGDLDMPRGKAAAQAGHAFTDALSTALDLRPADAARYRAEGGPKAVVEARGLREIERAHEAALAAGLPCALVVDSGHVLPPHFDGSPVVTALGIGPCARAEARPVTKGFRSVAEAPDAGLAVVATVVRRVPGGPGTREELLVSAGDEEGLYEALAEAAARCRDGTLGFSAVHRLRVVGKVDHGRLREAASRRGDRVPRYAGGADPAVDA